MRNVRYKRLHERIPLPADEIKPNRKTQTRETLIERRNIANVVKSISEATYGQAPRWTNEEYVQTLIWELTDGDEVRERLGLSVPAPIYRADAMHPWVWDAARPLWTSGNHDAAVWAAAVNVNSRLQHKVERYEIGETKLLNEVFSVQPPELNRPRLRLADQTNPDLFKDVHIGTAALGRGLYSAVRNPLNHVEADVHQIGEAEALEALAGFSLLSRWIDRADVATVE